MGRDKGVSTGYRGQHEAGKHTKRAQEARKAQPRDQKGQVPGADTTIIHIEPKPKSLLDRLFGE